jgi:hypothetical protein
MGVARITEVVPPCRRGFAAARAVHGGAARRNTPGRAARRVLRTETEIKNRDPEWNVLDTSWRMPDGDEQMETKFQNPGIGSARVGVAVSPCRSQELPSGDRSRRQTPSLLLELPN